MHSDKSVGKLFARFSHYIILFVLCVLMAVASPNFLKVNNIINVLRQSSLLLIMSMGMASAMLLGRGVDMSIGAIVAFSSCLAAQFLQAKHSTATVVLGFLVAFLVGAVSGMINGALVAYLKLPAILVTFGMREILRGLVYAYMDGGVVVNLHKSVTWLGAGRVFNKFMPVTVLAAVLVVLAMAFLFARTRTGRELYIVGANPVSAKFSGINVNLVIVKGFAISGLCSALAGILYIGRLGSAEAAIGGDFAFNAVSAAAIGGVSFNGGVGRVGGIVCGAIILNLITNGMNLLNIASTWQGIINGAVIIVAVLLDYYANRSNR